METNRPPITRQILRACASGVWSVAVWTLWLALSAALVFQIYIALARELPVPDFVLRRIERDLAETGVRAKFARTSFDPGGHVLVEKLELSLPEFPEPVLRARAVYLQANPWTLLAGRFEPRHIRVTGLDASVPAMLSSSGRAEEIVTGLDATFVPAGLEIGVTHLSARIAGIAVSARGTIALPKRGPKQPPQSLAEIVSTQFPKYCRQAIAIKGQLDGLEEPSLVLVLSPSDTRLAVVDATLYARSLSIEQPLIAHLSGLRIVTRVPLIGDAPATSHLDLTADELRLPLNTGARGVRATLIGRFLPGGYRFEPRELRLNADSVESSGFSAGALSAQLFPQPLPQLEADVVAQIMGAPMAVRAAADFKAKSATLRFAGAVSPAVLTPLSTRLKADVRKYFDFTTLDCVDGEVQLGPNWKFEKLTARVAVRGIDAYRVKLSEGRATVELRPGQFHSPDAFARIGENFARGSYSHDLTTHQYRFLLQGRLRPMDISGWFHDWWPDFFKQLEFPDSPPRASVDVAGFWREGRRSTVFVAADTLKPVVRGAAFDHLWTRLFIRPGYFDGLEVVASRDRGAGRGTFTYATTPDTHALHTFDFDLASTLDLALAGKILGPAGAQTLAPFKFAQPPEVRLGGRITGPDAPGGAHQQLQVRVRSVGDFRYQDFPLQDASFSAVLRDNDVTVDNFEARFAGGAALGRVRVFGTGPERRLGFTLTLQDASLGQVAGALQRYVAEINHRPPAPPGKFVQEKANVRMDLAAVAEGRYAEPYSFVGDGTISMRGEEIGAVPMLGLLSGLLKFTELRFTTANAKFKINGAKLEFPEVALRGANSAIDAHGDYALDRKELDFKAKVFPFQESNNLIKSVVGAVLSPISNVFEVKLTGNLEKPEWAFVIGPTNFLRSLAPDAPDGNRPAEPGPGTAPKSAPNGTPNPAKPIQASGTTASALPPVTPSPPAR